MKKLRIVLAVGVLSLVGGAWSLADHHGEAAPALGPPAEMKKMEPLNGEYEVKFFYKMDPTSPEWTETTATATLSTVAGGSAQQLDFKGDMMGMPLHGIGLTSYDREKKQWQTTWVDSVSGRISMYTGDFKDGKMVVHGEDVGGGQTFKARLTTYNMTDKGFDWKYEMSMDGTNYIDGAKATYRRK